jgi:hypothetical protein
MAAIVYGSYAIGLNRQTYRRPMDLDIIATYNEAIHFSSRFFETIESVDHKTEHNKLIFKGQLKNSGLVRVGIVEANLVESDVESTDKEIYDGMIGVLYNEELDLHYLDLDMLYLIKMSHRYKKNSPHFLKTMRDIHLFREYGASISEDRVPLLKRREKESYNYKHPSLNQGKKDFFSGDGIKYEWDHDSIHVAMAVMDKPAYTYYIEPGEEVKCSKKLFFEASEEVRLNGVLEESMVLALERAQLTSQIKFPLSPDKSFEFALGKVCTSITSGWFREYAWENYHRVFNLYKRNHTDYVEKAKEAIKSGVIKPFTGSLY